jgi:hypothetical protein
VQPAGRIRARRNVGAVLTLMAALGAAGCEGGGEEEQLKSAFEGLQEDFASHDAAGVCERVSERAKEQVGSLGHNRPTTCARDVRRLFGWVKDETALDAGGGRAPRFAAAKVDGDEAVVRVTLTTYAKSRVEFVREGGEWKLDNFFGITGPPPIDLR